MVNKLSSNVKMLSILALQLQNFEYQFVHVLKKKQPIRTMYYINTLFWLDNFGVRIRKSHSKVLRL